MPSIYGLSLLAALGSRKPVRRAKAARAPAEKDRQSLARRTGDRMAAASSKLRHHIAAPESTGGIAFTREVIEVVEASDDILPTSNHGGRVGPQPETYIELDAPERIFGDKSSVIRQVTFSPVHLV